MDRVIVTRPRDQADAWIDQLRGAGLEAVAFPLIDIGPAPNADAVATAWENLPARRVVMFVSPAAAVAFFRARPTGATWPRHLMAAATGPGTVAALVDLGIPPGQIIAPPPDSVRFDSEALWRRLSDQDWHRASILIVRGADEAGDGARGAGRDWLTDTWTTSGAAVSHIAAYQRSAPELDEAGMRLLSEFLSQPQRHVWLFSSSQAVRHLAAMVGGRMPAGIRAVATHPRIAEAARRAGIGPVEDARPDAQAIAAAVRELAN